MFNPTHFHPLVVHFPIALILAGFLAEVLFLFYKKQTWLSQAGFYLMVLGTLGAGAAFLTGHLFTSEPTEGSIMEVFEPHETFALITLIIIAAATLIRIAAVVFKKNNPAYRWLWFGLYCLGALSVMYTGHLGGTMVMDYMIGIGL